jgi:PAS domain S-box-containing protein
MREGTVFQVERVSALPPEAALERAEFEAESIKSLIVVPMLRRGALFGFLGFDSVRAEKRWSEDAAALLQIVGQIVTTALVRRATEHALTESEARLRALVEHLHDIIFVVDPLGTFLSETPSASRLLGYPPGHLIGKNGFLFMHPDDVAPMHLALGGVVAGTRGGVPHEVRLRKSDGSYVSFEGVASNLLDVPGVSGVAVTLRDLSDRKRAEEARLALEARLREAQKLQSLGVLAGGIAHDFNNLLTGVLGNASLALAGLPEGSPARESVRLMETAAQRAAELTQQLLAYSGKGHFVKERVQLSDVVREMAHLLEVSISKRCALELRFAPELPAVEADVAQLRQVVMNLIINAAEAIGDRQGRISLSTGEVEVAPGASMGPLEEELAPGPHVYLEVRDDGAGMCPAVRERIFDPFFTTKFTGRGLGLAAVLGIVRGHRGAVRVESEPGRGTSFRVLLPIAAPCVRAVDGTPPCELPTPPAGGTILVVDDDETVRRVARAVLEREGYIVLLARDGSEAVELFGREATRVRLVLLDLTMPGMDGKETFQALRALRPDVPVLLSSGYEEHETTSRFAGAGLAGFVHKPYSRDRLLRAVAQAMRRAQRSSGSRSG